MSITLKSGDDQSFTISEAASKKSPYIQKQVEGGKDTIIFDQMKGDVLSKIAEYLHNITSLKLLALNKILSVHPGTRSL